MLVSGRHKEKWRSPFYFLDSFRVAYEALVQPFYGHAERGKLGRWVSGPEARGSGGGGGGSLSGDPCIREPPSPLERAAAH